MFKFIFACIISLGFCDIGHRSAGMGSAFVGVADDINCLYYNPAGLAFIEDKRQEFGYLGGGFLFTEEEPNDAYYAYVFSPNYYLGGFKIKLPFEKLGYVYCRDMELRGDRKFYAGYERREISTVIGGTLTTVTVTYGRSTVGGGERINTYHQLSIPLKLNDFLAIGFNIKYFKLDRFYRTMALKREGEGGVCYWSYKSSYSAMGIDVGTFLKLKDNLNIGICVLNINEPKFVFPRYTEHIGYSGHGYCEEFICGRIDIVMERILTLGMGYKLADKVLLAFDIKNSKNKTEYRAGIELIPFSKTRVRFGCYSLKDMVLTFGVDYRFPIGYKEKQIECEVGYGGIFYTQPQQRAFNFFGLKVLF